MALAFEILIRAVKGFGKDRCGIFAAGITYFTLLSLFPLMLLALGVFGFFYSDPEDQQRLVDDLLDNLPLDGDSRTELEDIIASVARASGALGLIGLLGMAYSGSALFTAVRTSLNAVYKVEKPRNFVLGKLIDLGMVFLFGVFFLVSLAASFAITFAARFSEDIVGGEAARAFSILMTVVYILVPPIITAAVFWLLFTIVPARRFPWRYTLVGALVAAALFEALKLGFAQYVAAFGNYDATYGALGFVIVLLLFVSFASQVTLLGAQVVYATGTVAPSWPLPEDESEGKPILDKVQAFRKKLPGASADASDNDASSPSVSAVRAGVDPAPDAAAPTGVSRRGGGNPLSFLFAVAGIMVIAALAVVRGRRAARDDL